MLREAGKLVVFVASSAVAVPYTIAFVANMLYGWPRCEKRLRRAFHPRKVYSLNFALLQELTKLRYAKLWLKWKSYYGSLFNPFLIKDIPFGTNEQSLDLYKPEAPPNGGVPAESPLPVVVFLYGGTWGSGDKNMYGLLCSQLAKQLQAIVICPNYSTYPRGYIDDMVQDVVDCLMWIEHYISQFGGNKEKIMIIGHSAGGHLAMMGVLGITMKRLIHSPHSLILDELHSPPVARPSVPSEVQLRFEDRHFDGSSQDSNGAQPPAHSVGTSLTDIDNGSGRSSDNSESFYMVDKNSKLEESVEVDKNEEEDVEKTDAEKLVESQDTGKNLDTGESRDGESRGESQDVGDANKDEQESREDEESSELLLEDDLTDFQRDVKNIVNSIKCVIGLAGVYDIEDHYEHEMMRGVEDLSTMARAMYGPDNFDRFSPTTIVASLPQRTRLPPVTLVHGTRDHVVPVSSSDKFGIILQQMGGGVINQVRLPECNHYDICLDLMDPGRPFYDVLVEIIKREAAAYL